MAYVNVLNDLRDFQFQYNMSHITHGVFRDDKCVQHIYFRFNSARNISAYREFLGNCRNLRAELSWHFQIFPFETVIRWLSTR